MFISVAPRETAAEKMNKFLDINPMVPRERLFVDDSPTFAAYASAGFKNIGEDQKTSLADATKLTAPRLSAGAWRRYLTNVASLSPVPDGLKFGEVPEGVLRCVEIKFTAAPDALVDFHAGATAGRDFCGRRRHRALRTCGQVPRRPPGHRRRAARGGHLARRRGGRGGLGRVETVRALYDAASIRTWCWSPTLRARGGRSSWPKIVSFFFA